MRLLLTLLFVFGVGRILSAQTVLPLDSAMVDSARMDEAIEVDRKIVYDEEEINLCGHGIFICPFYYHVCGNSEYEKAKQEYKKTHPYADTFDPSYPFFWYGTSTFHPNGSSTIPLRSGFGKHTELGLTFIDISKNLYKKSFGFTWALQMFFKRYEIEKDMMAQNVHGRLDFVPVSSGQQLKTNKITFYGARIPFVIGYQTPYKIFALRTGLNLNWNIEDHVYEFSFSDNDKNHEEHIHINPITVDWTTIVSLGPLTLTYSRGLLPIFRLVNGKRVYETTLTFGLDLWWRHRLKGH